MVALDPRDRSTVLVHYYRAMVGRADIWRMRMDATTNWAIGATAAVTGFVLGNPATPPSALAIASLLTLAFLLLEARRLTFYHLWQQRVLWLERALVRPVLGPGEPQLDLDALAQHLEPQLGTTVPSMSITKAVARRLRRIYLYLFGVHWLAWLLKLSAHPEPAGSLSQTVARAGLAGLPGAAVVALSLAGLAFAVGLAVVVGGVVGGVDRKPAS
ncbi:MAG: DUF2270 domain-containing protein [Myxococcota bacterium]